MLGQAAKITAEVDPYRECPATKGSALASAVSCSPSSPGNKIVAGEISWFTRMPAQPISPIAKTANNIPNGILHFVLSTSIHST
jgi:hypothetical protein